jgi:hypothetical protein
MPSSRSSKLDVVLTEDLYIECFQVSIIAYDKIQARLCLHGV